MASPKPLSLRRILYGTTEELLAWPKAAPIGEGFYNTETGELVKGPGLYADCVRRAGADVPVLVVDFAHTTNLTIASGLNATDSAGGVTVTAGMIGLLVGETAAATNGPYTCGVTPARRTGFTTYNSMAGKLFYVKSGTNAGKYYRCVSAAGGTIDVTDLVFEEVQNKPVILGRKGQAATLPAKTTVNASDLLILEDSEADGGQKKITQGNLILPALTKAGSGEVAALSAEASPDDAHLVILEVGGVKKKVALSALKTYFTA